MRHTPESLQPPNYFDAQRRLLEAAGSGDFSYMVIRQETFNPNGESPIVTRTIRLYERERPGILPLTSQTTTDALLAFEDMTVYNFPNPRDVVEFHEDPHCSPDELKARELAHAAEQNQIITRFEIFPASEPAQ